MIIIFLKEYKLKSLIIRKKKYMKRDGLFGKFLVFHEILLAQFFVFFPFIIFTLLLWLPEEFYHSNQM